MPRGILGTQKDIYENLLYSKGGCWVTVVVHVLSDSDVSALRTRSCAECRCYLWPNDEVVRFQGRNYHKACYLRASGTCRPFSGRAAVARTCIRG